VQPVELLLTLSSFCHYFVASNRSNSHIFGVYTALKPAKIWNPPMNDPQIFKVLTALDSFRSELPFWGFADTGTRFGKFLQDAAAIDVQDNLADAGQVYVLTGC
jgi:hypothetical protein